MDPRANLAGAEPENSRTARLTRTLDWIVILGAVATIPLLILDETYTTGLGHVIARVGDWTVWLLFVLDYLVMGAITDNRRTYVKTHWLNLAVIVLTPPFIPAGIQWLRALQVLRVVRLAALPRLLRRRITLEAVEYGGLVVGISVIAGAAAFSAAQRVSYGNGFYWAVGTVTTSGSGNVIATTGLAKLVACVLMVIGTSFLALVTGALAQRFLASDVQNIESGVSDVRSDTQRLRQTTTDTSAAVYESELDDARIRAQMEHLSSQMRELEEMLDRRLS